MSRSYKTAGICFLGFGNCDTDIGFSKDDNSYKRKPEDLCREEVFFLSACALPTFPDKYCPYTSNLFKSCKEDKERACTNAGFENSCPEGYIKDASQLCPYDTSYFKCIINPCDGYNYTYDEANETGFIVDGFCLSDDESKYKRKENPCSDFLTCECGGEIGSETCVSGTVKKYAVCKQCYKPCASGLIDIDNYWCGGVLKCFLK